MLAYGIFKESAKSYFRDGWNILEFTVLIFSYICITDLKEQFKVLKALRMLRSLRLIGKNEGLKIAVRALFFAIPNVISITTIMLLFFMIFAVIFISHYKGKLYYCSYQLESQFLHEHDKWDCLNAGGLWQNRVYNWDSMGDALCQLLIMATTAGWGEMAIQTSMST
jgi:Ion transport protein